MTYSDLSKNFSNTNLSDILNNNYNYPQNNSITTASRYTENNIPSTPDVLTDQMVKEETEMKKKNGPIEDNIEKRENKANLELYANNRNNIPHSKTFRPVGPYIDSTVDLSGVKYSSKFKFSDNNEKVGFYGRSRLTRY